MENALVHQLDGAVRLISDLRLEVHLVEDLGLQVDARSDLGQGNAFRTQLKYAALGDVQNGLVHLVGVIAGEGDLLHLVDELLLGTLLGDDQLAVLALGLEALGGKGAAVNDLLGVLGNVDEATGAGQTGAELGDVQVAVGSGLGQAQEGHVQAAALIEVELDVVVQNGHGVGCAAELGAAVGHTGDGAGFHGGYNHIVYQMVGQPLGVFYLPHSTGLESDGNGGYTYGIADLNGGGVSLEDGEDRYVAGQAVPKTILGSNISFRYKRFDLSLQVNGAFGHKIYNGTSLTYMNMNIFPDYNVMKKAPKQNIKDQTATDYWLEKGDYVNFDYVTLGWNVPIEKVQKLKKYVRSLRLAFTVNNLATISGYSGLSPMINSSTVNSTLGVDDKRGYPLARTYTLGLSINF